MPHTAPGPFSQATKYKQQISQAHLAPACVCVLRVEGVLG